MSCSLQDLSKRFITQSDLDEFSYNFVLGSQNVIEKRRHEVNGIKGVSYFLFKDNDAHLELDQAHECSIFIFDISGDNQNMIREYFSICRQKSFYGAYIS